METCQSMIIKILGTYTMLNVFKDSEPRIERFMGFLWFYFGDRTRLAGRQGNALSLGKNMGEVMKQIEALL